MNIIEGFNYSGVTSIHKIDDSTRFVIGTKDNGLFQLKISGKGKTLSRFKDHPEWETLSIQSIAEDSEHSLWISTIETGVIQMQFSENSESLLFVHTYNINSGLTANYVKTVFQDLEGNYWMGFLWGGNFNACIKCFRILCTW